VPEIPEGFKRCSKGEQCVHPMGCILPVSEFSRNNKAKSGFESQCRECRRASKRKWRAANPAKVREQRQRAYWKDPEKARSRSRDYARREPDKVKQRRRIWYENNVEHAREYGRRYGQEHRAEQTAKRREWAKNNPEKTRAQKRRYYERHKEHIKAKSSRWYYNQDPADINRKARERRRRWRLNNPDTRQVSYIKRRARKRELPAQFTQADWQRALEYFEYRCAYCYDFPEEGTVLEADHFIPLRSRKCPGTVPENMIPACRSCNRSKSKKSPKKWLEQRFSPLYALIIIGRIQDYIRWLKTQQNDEGAH